MHDRCPDVRRRAALALRQLGPLLGEAGALDYARGVVEAGEPRALLEAGRWLRGRPPTEADAQLGDAGGVREVLVQSLAGAQAAQVLQQAAEQRSAEDDGLLGEVLQKVAEERSAEDDGLLGEVLQKVAEARSAEDDGLLSAILELPCDEEDGVEGGVYRRCWVGKRVGGAPGARLRGRSGSAGAA